MEIYLQVVIVVLITFPPVKSHTCSFSLSIHPLIKSSSSYVIFCQAAVPIKISNLIISFCSFDLSSPIHKKDNFIANLYIVLSCLVLLNSIAF